MQDYQSRDSRQQEPEVRFFFRLLFVPLLIKSHITVSDCRTVFLVGRVGLRRSTVVFFGQDTEPAVTYRNHLGGTIAWEFMYLLVLVDPSFLPLAT